MTNKELAQSLNVPPSRISEWIKRGMPRDATRAQVWRMNNAKPRKAPKVPGVSLEKSTPPAGTEEMSWDARLDRARKLELRLHDQMVNRIAKLDVMTLAKLQASHIAVIREIAEAEKLARENAIASGDMVSVADAREIIHQCLGPLREALDNLPMGERFACNPEHPEVAEAALTAWRDRLLATGSAFRLPVSVESKQADGASSPPVDIRAQEHDATRA